MTRPIWWSAMSMVESSMSIIFLATSWPRFDRTQLCPPRTVRPM
jgi:hypothetical protein